MNFPQLLTVITTLFFLMATGFLAGKLGIIDETASKKLSKIILTIGQPCLLLSSLLKKEYSPENLKLGLLTLLFGFIFHFIVAAFAILACSRFKEFDEKKLSQFAIVFGNAGFIGFPILESLFGEKGLFMGAFFVAAFNVLLWTLGLLILAQKRKDIKITPKKVLINFGTIPCAIGIILFTLNAPIPNFVHSTLSYLGGLCTPVSTLIIGALISRSSLAKVFSSGKIYYVCAIKLIIIPIALCAIMTLIGFNYDWVMFATTVCAMPCATAVSMLAETYDINPEYSARVVGMSSVLSVLTLPVVLKFAEFFIGLVR